MLKLLSLAIGGAIGTMTRYGISRFFYSYLKSSIPWGTLLINVSGSFLIGLLWGLFQSVSISSNLRSFLFIGFLGAFTTFSAYSLEILILIQNSQISNALIYIFLSNILSIFFVFLGFSLSKFFI